MQVEATHSPSPSEVDQRVFLSGLSWNDFETFLRMRGEDAQTRIAFRDGVLEIMAPSIHHERRKTVFGALVETFLTDEEIPFFGGGSWTMRNALTKRGIEPDECCVVGREFDDSITVADLALEVVWTSGGLDKLDIYAGLGVREVWFWRDGKIEVNALRTNRYELIDGSELLPQLDLELLARFVSYRDQGKAIREYRAALAAS